MFDAFYFLESLTQSGRTATILKLRTISICFTGILLFGKLSNLHCCTVLSHNVYM